MSAKIINPAHWEIRERVMGRGLTPFEHMFLDSDAEGLTKELKNYARPEFIAETKKITICGFCAKKMTADDLTGENCSGCEKWVCGTCYMDYDYLERDVNGKKAFCDWCMEDKEGDDNEYEKVGA